METRANHALVGLFTLAIIAAAFGFVYWFRAASSSGDRKAYRIVFVGSVSGLSKGAAVRFNGIRVGEVTSVDFVKEDPSRVAATIEVNPDSPMKTDTKAKLEFQGLTGVASVQLSGNASDALALTNPDGKGLPTIFADRSDFQDLLETAQRLAGKVDGMVSKLEKVVSENEGPVGNTIRNVEGFSKALNDNSPAISSFLAQLGSSAQKFSTLSERLDRLADGADGLLRGVDSQALGRAVRNIDQFTQGLADNRPQMDTLMGEGASLLRRLNEASPKLDQALMEVNRLVVAIDAQKINRAVDGAEKFATALGRNSQTVDDVMKEVNGIVQKVSQAAERLDSVMKGAEGFLGDGQTKGTMVEIGETAKAIRKLANNLDKRTAEITSGINRFSGPGLRELESLTTDARKAVNDVGRAVRNLERNPQQIITGSKSSIPEYNGGQ